VNRPEEEKLALVFAGLRECDKCKDNPNRHKMSFFCSECNGRGVLPVAKDDGLAT